ncbi:MAG: hypothetical protein AAGG68_05505 [Bacteroidota bacterium]
MTLRILNANEQEHIVRAGRSCIRVVLPYEEVLTNQNTDLLIYKQIYQQLDLLDWLDTENIKIKLQHKIAELN